MADPRPPSQNLRPSSHRPQKPGHFANAVLAGSRRRICSRAFTKRGKIEGVKNALNPLRVPKMARRFRFLQLVLLSTVAILISPKLSSAQLRSPAFVHNLAADLGLQGRIMWVDGSANIDRITT